MTEITIKRGSGGGVSFDPDDNVVVSPEGTVTWTSGDANMKLTGLEFVGGLPDGFVVSVAVKASGAKTGEYPYKIRYTDGDKQGESAGTVRVATSVTKGSTGKSRAKASTGGGD